MDPRVPLTDPRLINYFNEISKDGYISLYRMPSLVLDFTDGSKPYDFNELMTFMKEYFISDVAFKISDANDFGKNILKRFLPLNLFNVTIDGNLNGLVLGEQFDDYELKERYESIKKLSLHHTGQTPAHIKSVSVPQSAFEFKLENIGVIDNLTRDKSGFLSQTNFVPDSVSLGVDFSNIEVKDLDLRQIPRNLVDVKEIHRRFPKLETLNIGYKGDPIKYDSIRDALEDLQTSGHIKTTRGLATKLKRELIKSTKKDELKYTKRELLANLVEFSDGTYVDARKVFTVSKDELIFDEFERTKDPVVKLQIRELSQLTMEEALRIKEQTKDKKQVCVVFENNHHYSTGAYSLDKYIAILDRYNEILEGITPEMPEEKRYALIHERVAKGLEYDTPAAYPHGIRQRLYKEVMKYSCRNFDALLEGKGVCAAYALIEAEACKLAGLDCKYISGPVDSVGTSISFKSKEDRSESVKRLSPLTQIEREYHAWTKVKINGKWYNSDPTWDSGDLRANRFPSYALLSDKTLLRSGRNGIDENGPKCMEDATEEMIRTIYPKTKRSSHRNIFYDRKVLKFETGEQISDIKPTRLNKIRDRLRNVFSFRKLLSSGKDSSQFEVSDLTPADEIHESQEGKIKDENPFQDSGEPIEELKSWVIEAQQREEIIKKQNEIGKQFANKESLSKAEETKDNNLEEEQK